MYKRIVLAYDGSETGQKALLDALDIAQWSHAELHLIAVMPPAAPLVAVEGVVYDSALQEELRRNYQAILDDGLRRLADAGYPARGEVLVGDQVEAITSYARRVDADLIVVGHKHLDSWAARWWRASRSPALIEHAHCSVLVVITR
ncbi:MAG: universal stress protein [Sutterellaceae bacterium]|nr:universal stress protein [Burkholderiaceae bacterium]MDW8430556.1 universal stress protein [Sutterellaceae bacterium]